MTPPLIGVFYAWDDQRRIIIYAQTKILAEFALQCKGFGALPVVFLNWAADNYGPLGHVVPSWLIGLYVRETERDGYDIIVCPVTWEPVPQTSLRPAPPDPPRPRPPRYQARPQPRPETDVSTVLDPETLKRRQAIDAPPELPLPVHAAPPSTGDVHLLKDDVDRRAIGVLAWAPWVRRRRYASRRYEGFGRTGSGGW